MTDISCIPGSQGRYDRYTRQVYSVGLQVYKPHVIKTSIEDEDAEIWHTRASVQMCKSKSSVISGVAVFARRETCQ